MFNRVNFEDRNTTRCMSHHQNVTLRSRTRRSIIRRKPKHILRPLDHPRVMNKQFRSLSFVTFGWGEVTLGMRKSTCNCPLSVFKYGPSLEKDKLVTKILVLSSWSAPVFASQSRTVQSCEADATSRPSGENATALTHNSDP